METRDFFSTAQRMRGYSGDTFPYFYVKTDAKDLKDCTMRLVLENNDTPRSVAYTKACTPHTFEDETLGFAVQLTSAETAGIGAGTYTMHFIMTDSTGCEYRKLVASMILRDVPKEGE